VVGIDDPESPAVLRDLMEALGATVVDDPVQTQCCGAYHVVNRDEIVCGRVEATVAQARARGAAAMVLSCPLCHFNFDSRQTEVAAPLPVFYFTQLMAVAFGLERSVFGFEAHQIDPWPLLRQHGLA
jgi:heterodisulfide reductase subunit B